MDMYIEACAHAAHETNAAYCAAIGDPPQPSWASAPDELKESVRAGVKGVLLGNDERTSHEGWCKHLREHGWVYGQQKSRERKTHPNLVPYSELPRTQQHKDGLFVGAVRTMAAALGLTVIYPAEPARGGRPAIERREINWSTGETRVIPPTGD
jgi:hypothetical protein